MCFFFSALTYMSVEHWKTRKFKPLPHSHFLPSPNKDSSLNFCVIQMIAMIPHMPQTGPWTYFYQWHNSHSTDRPLKCWLFVCIPHPPQKNWKSYSESSIACCWCPPLVQCYSFYHRAKGKLSNNKTKPSPYQDWQLSLL